MVLHAHYKLGWTIPSLIVTALHLKWITHRKKVYPPTITHVKDGHTRPTFTVTHRARSTCLVPLWSKSVCLEMFNDHLPANILCLHPEEQRCWHVRQKNMCGSSRRRPHITALLVKPIRRTHVRTCRAAPAVGSRRNVGIQRIPLGQTNSFGLGASLGWVKIRSKFFLLLRLYIQRYVPA